MSRSDAQQYWIEQHGPLVIRVGLPPVITSYSQIHFGLNGWQGGLFDDEYQGLSYETITSQADLACAAGGGWAGWLRHTWCWGIALVRGSEGFG